MDLHYRNEMRRIKKALKKAVNCRRKKFIFMHFTETDKLAGSELANQGDLLDNVRPNQIPFKGQAGSES